MSLENQLRNGLKAAALWLPLPPERKSELFYDLYEDLFALLAGNSGVRNLGFLGNGSTIPEIQAELCRRTVASLPRPGRWLDVGCGEGGAACLLAEEDPTVEITGLDLHREGISRAGSRVEREGLRERVDFALGDACEMPFVGSGLFDGVYAIETACHYRDKDAFAREVARVLRPEGRFACSDFVLSTDGIDRPERPVVQWALQGIGIPEMYTTDEWRACLEQAAFREVRVHDITVPTFGCLPLWLERYEEIHDQLERLYPPALIAALKLNVRWLNDGVDGGQLRYILIEARA